MSDLFKAGKVKRTTGGGFTVSAAGGSDILKRLQKLETGGKVAIERTVSDFTTRAPAWVSKGIREHYGVDAAAIKDAVKKPKRGTTSLKVAGIQVDGATLEYEGRLLTPTHFKMKPAARPPGNKKYKVKATVIKGQRKILSSNAFLGRASKSEDAKIIPWQRVGDGRLPVRVIKSISVPQMAGGRGEDGKEHVSLASESIRKELDQGLTKRFDHHMNRVMK